MRENLDMYFSDNGKPEKRSWYDRNRVEDLSTLSSQILRSYRRFATATFPDVNDYDEYMALDTQILAELSPHDREAFRLALHFNHQPA